jgi:lipoate-protein ligase A
MLFIDNENVTDPSINLAIEEYALKHLDINNTYLLFYINEPSIIIGKNQNTIEEINSKYVKEHTIHVVRRLSGGGAVYHDEGNPTLASSRKMMETAFTILKSLPTQ